MDIFGVGNPFYGLNAHDPSIEDPQAELEVLREWRSEELEKGPSTSMDLVRWINTEIEKRVKPYSYEAPWTKTKGAHGFGRYLGQDVLAPAAPPVAEIKKTLKAMSKLPMPMRRSSAGIIEWLRKPEALRRAVSFIKSSMNNLKAGKYSAAASSAFSAAVLAGRASEDDSALASRIINTAKALIFASLKRQKKI